MGELIWHGHDDNDCPIEYLTGTLEGRAREIIAKRPLAEHETRLRLLKLCSPAAVPLYREFRNAEAKLWRSFRVERRTNDDLPEWAKYTGTIPPRWTQYAAMKVPLWADYEKLKAPLLAPILALHATECGCTEWNGREIVFPSPKG